MKVVASSDTELSVEERNLLSVAYKNVIGARRASWRIVTSIEQKEESKGNESQVNLIKEYRQKIEAELAKICEDILEVLEKHLIPSATHSMKNLQFANPWLSSVVHLRHNNGHRGRHFRTNGPGSMTLLRPGRRREGSVTCLSPYAQIPRISTTSVMKT